MLENRRQFLKNLGVATAVGACASEAQAFGPPTVGADSVGVLLDTTACVGCRLCEYACKEANGLPTGTLESYNDTSVFAQMRRPSPVALTVVNEWKPQGHAAVYAKVNCMHCNDPACVSACIVGAMRKQPSGQVTYDVDKCIGCRYCMEACPFQIPAYEYDNAFTPQIRKCQLCFQRRTSQGKAPACVDACPREALIFGKRTELLQVAHDTIAKHPKEYVDHIYGEHEVGGTAWMYLSSVPFSDLGFPTLGRAPVPRTTESIQRALFQYAKAPLGMIAFFGAMMLAGRTRRNTRTMQTRMSAPPVENAPHFHEQEHHEFPQPVARPFFTPGVFILLAVMLTGMVAYAWRFIFGLASVTNLDQQHPWGLWVGVDVASGVALAAGGFAAVAMVRVFHMRQFEPLVRPALLTALLGYTAVVTGLLADLGRYYNVWHPLMPWMWQGNSVLFEVGICEVGCLNLLYLIFAPIFLERLRDENKRFPRLAKLAARVHPILERVMAPFIIAGLIAAVLHQSALGNLLVITPYKLHPLWETPMLSALFLISAIGGGGLAMMCWESLFASWSLKLAPEMHVLSRLAKLVWPVMGIYLLAKVADVFARGAFAHLRDSKALAACWLAEVILGLLVPVVMLMFRSVRENPRRLFIACTLIVFGVIFNRINIFVIAYNPPYAKRYIPSFGEFAITCGLFAFLMLGYRLVITMFPVISQPASDPGTSSVTRPSRPCVVRPDEVETKIGASTGGTPVSQKPILNLVPAKIVTALLVLAAAQFARGQSTQPAQDIPNIVMLDQLSKSEGLYEPVPFNHKAHATMAQMKNQCTTCHHRTPEATTTRASSNGNAKIGGQQSDAAKHPACRTCHEPHRADLRQPGLKGAYHRQCLNCHREWAEANNCNVCHKPVQFAATGPVHDKLATEDDIVGRMHPPIPEPKVKTFKTELTPADGPLVVFRHTEHTARYGLSCATCHKDDSCSRCHQPNDKTTKPAPVAPRTELAEADWETVHRNCNSCHPRQETHCNTCHYKTDQQPPAPFDHAMTGQLLDADHAKLNCNTCHSTWTPKAAITCGTSGCHVTTSAPVTFPAMRPGPVLPAKKDLPPVKVIPVPLKDGKTKIASGGAP